MKNLTDHEVASAQAQLDRQSGLGLALSQHVSSSDTDRSSDRAEQSLDSLHHIAQTPPFQGLSPYELDAVRRAAHLRRVKRKNFFFHQGDQATCFYILVEGRIRLTEVTADGQQVLVRFVRAGEAIGLIAALEDTVYPLAAQAVEDCLALAWDGLTLEQLMERYPSLALNALQMVSERHQELQKRYLELATERVERRVAHTVLRLARQAGQKVEGGILIDLPLTRQDLAEMTGTTLYTVSRIVSRWEEQGLVEAGRGSLLIRTPHSLMIIAEDLPPNTPSKID
jgi:CRP-like cAMP-binding protein